MATADGDELLVGQKRLRLPQRSVALPWHQNPAGHGKQRALEVSFTLASYVDGGHGRTASQNGWPGKSWNLPAGQRWQVTALALLEK